MEPSEAKGRYRLLQRYLDERFANTVVLRFTEIEDILGFPLPDTARQHQAWWANPHPDSVPSEQSASWTSSSRTAGVNIAARKVTFTRLLAPEGRTCTN